MKIFFIHVQDILKPQFKQKLIFWFSDHDYHDSEKKMILI